MTENKNQSTDFIGIYTEKYFLNNVTGFEHYKNFNGRFEQLDVKYQEIINLINLRVSDELLDIGCGRAEIIMFHAKNGGNATGVDFSKDAIDIATEKARELAVNCSLVTSSFQEIPEDKKYTKIVANDFIEHINEMEGISFFKKCMNLLEKDGTLLVFTGPNTFRRKIGYPIIRFFSGLKGIKMPKQEIDSTGEDYKLYHLNEQNCVSIKKLARKGGFENIRVIYSNGHDNHSKIKNILAYTPFRHLIFTGLILIAKK